MDKTTAPMEGIPAPIPYRDRPVSSSAVDLPIEADRGHRFFEFLYRIVQLSSRTLRTIEQYQDVLWLHQVPEEPGCKVFTRDPRPPEKSWLIIDRPELPAAPELPHRLEGWLEEKTVRDHQTELELPDVATFMVTKAGLDGGVVQALEERNLSDFPEVAEEFEHRYLPLWKKWAKHLRKVTPVLQVYRHLFEMCQSAQVLGEQYETVLGVGFLTWAGSGGPARRHLFTFRALLQLDRNSGRISVVAHPDGPAPTVEEDMLGEGQAPSPDVALRIQQQLLENEQAGWDVTTLEGLLKIWRNTADPEGLYEPGLVPRAGAQERCHISFAPAVLLRKRNQRNLQAFLRSIQAQLEQGVEVPAGVTGLLSPQEEPDEPDPDQKDPGSEAGPEGGRLFFPLQANAQQKEVVERLRRHSGVVVQGPPGTGKSQTIANLVSHLLAEGKRVLVTSHTSRALEVLREKIPPVLDSLCVTLVGQGRAGSQELRRSVEALLAKHDDPAYQAGPLAEKVQRIESRLADVARQKEDTLEKLANIQKRECDRHILGFGGYEGSLADIAGRLREEEARFSWMGRAPDREPPLRTAEARELLGLLRRFDEDSARRAEETVPEAMPAPEEFDRLLDLLGRLQAELEALEQAARHPEIDALRKSAPEQLKALLEALKALKHRRDHIARFPQKWPGAVLGKVLGGNLGELVQLQKTTMDGLSSLADPIETAEALHLDPPGQLGPEHRTIIISLREHLRAGRGVTGFFNLRHSIVRSSKEFRDKFRVNDRRPETLEDLEDLLSFLDARKGLEGIETLWAPLIEGELPPSLSLRRARLEDALKVLDEVLRLQADVEAAQRATDDIRDLQQPRWDDDGEVQALLDATGRARAERERQDVLTQRARWAASIADLVNQGGSAEACERALEALQGGQDTAYRQAFIELEEHREAQIAYARRGDLLSRLSSVCPQTAQRLVETADEIDWEARLDHFDEAWNWGRAERWYRQIQEAGEPEQVRQRLSHCEDQERTLLADLGETLAWQHCLARLKEEQALHLQAYARAVQRYGKGLGKQAHRHLQDAKRHMEACCGAVPVWIMPVYRVAETLPAAPESFDVIIVDEASQSGIDSLFLSWLAPKIVVVGDDRQISPEHVGIPKDEVRRCLDQFLGDLPLRDLFQLEHSLFDQAASRYRGRTWLREHFRCMPEIIAYSNRHYYQEHPLVPLRQFGTDRLPPLQRVYIEGAEMTGSRDKLNRREAKALVRQVIACHEDPAYEGLTFGVISLLGDSQARFIARELLEALGPDSILDRHLVCGDAYSFQGDERDVMFLSLVQTPDRDSQRIRALGDAGTPRRFNVAASRARLQMWLFHSVGLEHLNPNCPRHGLLQHFLNPPPQGIDTETGPVRPDIPHARFESLFEQRVFLKIRERKFQVVPQFEVYGRRIDLVVVGEASRLAVECDGDHWHGPERFHEDLARQKDLERCGWTFFRVLESDFYRDPDAALAPLWRMLESRGIRPEGEQATAVPLPDRSTSGAPPPDPSLKSANPREPEPVTEPGALRPHATEPFQAPLARIVRSTPPPGPNGIMDRPPGVPSPLLEPGNADQAVPAQALAIQETSPDRQPSVPSGALRVHADHPTPGFLLEPYREWITHPAPGLLDADAAGIIERLVEICHVEGPILPDRLYRLTVWDAGFHRLGKNLRQCLQDAARKAVREGRLEQEAIAGSPAHVGAIRIPGAPAIRVRARGPRDLCEVPLSEVTELMRALRANSPEMGEPELKREVLNLYNLVRLTRDVDAYLGRAFEATL